MKKKFNFHWLFRIWQQFFFRYSIIIVYSIFFRFEFGQDLSIRESFKIQLFNQI